MGNGVVIFFVKTYGFTHEMTGLRTLHGWEFSALSCRHSRWEGRIRFFCTSASADFNCYLSVTPSPLCYQEHGGKGNVSAPMVLDC